MRNQEGSERPSSADPSEGVASPPPREFRVGDWRVQADGGTLTREGETRHLGPQQIEVLAYLAANAGRVVPKDEIFAAVWRGAFVEEVGLPRCISEIRKALGDDARRPLYIETIPRRGYRLIAEVELRPAADETRGLSPAPSPPPRVDGRRGGDRGGRRPLRGLARAAPGLHPPRPQRRPHGRPTGRCHRALRPAVVAVLGFKNLSGDPDVAWLSSALSEMLAAELALSPELRVAPGETVARMKRELSIANADSFAPDTLRRIHTFLGADYVVLGSYLSLGAGEERNLRLNLRIQDDHSGETTSAVLESARAADIFALVSAAGKRLRSLLGAGAAGDDVDLAASSPHYLPQTPAGTPALLRGARPTRPPRRGWGAGGHRAVDRPGAGAALRLPSPRRDVVRPRRRRARRRGRPQSRQLAAELPPERRLWIEAARSGAAGRWDEAMASYRKLCELAPDDLEYALALANAENASGRPGEALATVGRLRRRIGASFPAPRLDLIEADAARLRGDPARSLVAATRAAEVGAEVGAALVVARGRERQATALHALGRFGEAAVAL